MAKTSVIQKLPSIPNQESLAAQEATYQRLRYAIMIGAIGPGVALTIRGIAELLDVSPTPVRESIRRLTTEGALQVLDNRRVVTPRMNLRRFDELIKLRVTLECHAAESVMPYINEIKIDELEKLDQQMDMRIARDDHESIVIHNLKFHSLLYQSNPDQIVMPLIESIWLQLGPYSRNAMSELTEFYLVDHHIAAIKALRGRDVNALKVAIAGDINDGIGKLGRRKLMEEC